MSLDEANEKPEAHRSVPCFHGGAFFDAIGDEFDSLERRHDIINADVLDAWFPPSPRVIAAINDELPWLLRTSPPTQVDGLARVIARVRGVAPENILPGAGSSDLIFLALRQWLSPASRILILDPMYGEYAHVLERVIGCRVVRLPLLRENRYCVDLPELTRLVAGGTSYTSPQSSDPSGTRVTRPSERSGYDLIVIVNPNSPTGQFIPRDELAEVLSVVPARTLVWLDETYIEYAGADQSLERFAAASPNVVVCKSMSKVYALSGARAAYLCGPAALLDGLRGFAPPWSVSLLAQVAAVAAVQDPDYYCERWEETIWLREQLAQQLAQLTGWDTVPGIANFLLCHLPVDGPSAAEIVLRCRTQGLFLRDVGLMGTRLGDRALRIAVKDGETNRCMLERLAQALRATFPAVPVDRGNKCPGPEVALSLPPSRSREACSRNGRLS